MINYAEAEAQSPPAAAFQILMSLADDDLHGYEIMRRVEEQTSGRTRLGPGTLYSSIQALLEAAFIAEVSRPSADETNDERRRYYRLTAAGRKAGREEAERLADILRIARAKNILRGNMFDRVVAVLLRLYPEEFRRVHGRDALQLMWDRAGHERGVWLRTRLLMDLTRDLVVTSLTWRPPAQALARIDGTPRFDILEPHRLRPEALAAGTLTSMLMLVSFALLFQPRVFPPVPAQLGEGSGGEPAGFESSGDSDQQVIGNGSGGRSTIIAAVADNLRQHYVDRAVGQQLSDALLAYEKNGAYASVANGRGLADRLNDDIYKTSRALGIAPGLFVADVVFFGDRPIPTGPPPQTTEATRERDRLRLLEQNCMFRAIEALPRHIGYVKLDGFMPPFACQETARRAMEAVNNSDALIIDLRDNRGGVGETALQIAGYLFDRPTFLYDPRPHSRVPSHTASPISGNTLADKPVYLLTSSRTQSAAEYFVYNLRMMKRVTIVGERTAGAQHSGAFRQIDENFGMGIQETEPPSNPYPVKGWEVIGIEPDVAVPGAEALSCRENARGVPRYTIPITLWGT